MRTNSYASVCALFLHVSARPRPMFAINALLKAMTSYRTATFDKISCQMHNNLFIPVKTKELRLLQKSKN